MYETSVGVTKGDTRSLGYSSKGVHGECWNN